MKQKFRKLSFVHVCKEMPQHMRYFPSNFDAIVDGTYSQIFGGDNIYNYSLYKIENNKIVNSISWYHESQLSLNKNQNRALAEDMIEEYNLRGDKMPSPENGDTPTDHDGENGFDDSHDAINADPEQDIDSSETIDNDGIDDDEE